jgi:hypothetical protein
MDLADKLGPLSLKNAPIQETGASFQNKTLRPEEEYPFGVQIKKFARLVKYLLSLNLQEASPSQFKGLNRAIGSLSAILDTSANFERQQLDSLQRSISNLDCYLKENYSKERTSLKKKVIPQTNKMLKSIESQIEIQTSRNEIKETRKANNESYRKSLIAKSSQNDAKKKEQGRKEPVFLKMTKMPIVTFGRTQTFLPPPLFRLFKKRSFCQN